MADQAESLRRQVEHFHSEKSAKVVSIVSGKGGVGKTNVSVNLAVGLSQIGKKVLLVDLDIGMANADLVAGVTAKDTIVDMVEKRMSVFDIMIQGPAGFSFIAGGSGLPFLFEMDAIKFTYFVRQLELLDQRFDYILFDMGAGLTKESADFILASHESIIIVTPEPTSVTDSYAMVKAIDQKDPHLPFYMIVNCCENEKEGYETSIRFKRAAKEFLQKDIRMIGTLPFDRTVTKAVKTQTPFLLLAPKSKVSQSMKKIVFTYTGEALSSSKPYGMFIASLRNLFSKGDA